MYKYWNSKNNTDLSFPDIQDNFTDSDNRHEVKECTKKCQTKLEFLHNAYTNNNKNNLLANEYLALGPFCRV